MPDKEAGDAARASRKPDHPGASNNGGNNDFVFRFKVDPDGDKTAVYDDPLTELIRSQLEALLEVVVLTRQGEEIRGVDGFKYMKHLERNFPIYPDGD